MDVAKFIKMVKVFAASGLMTPSFVVTVYLPVYSIGPWRDAILQDLNPNANVQVLVHVYEDNPYLAGASLNTSLYDHELIVFVGSKGDRDQFHFDPKGADIHRLGDPIRFWASRRKPSYERVVEDGWNHQATKHYTETVVGRLMGHGAFLSKVGWCGGCHNGDWHYCCGSHDEW
jgi:hypothetical protein